MSRNTNNFETVLTSNNTLRDVNTNNPQKSKLNNNKHSNNNSDINNKNGRNNISIRQQIRFNHQNGNISDENETVLGLMSLDSTEVEDRRTATRRKTAQNLSLYKLSARDTIADTIDDIKRMQKRMFTTATTDTPSVPDSPNGTSITGANTANLPRINGLESHRILDFI